MSADVDTTLLRRTVALSEACTEWETIAVDRGLELREMAAKLEEARATIEKLRARLDEERESRAWTAQRLGNTAKLAKAAMHEPGTELERLTRAGIALVSVTQLAEMTKSQRMLRLDESELSPCPTCDGEESHAPECPEVMR